MLRYKDQMKMNELLDRKSRLEEGIRVAGCRMANQPRLMFDIRQRSINRLIDAARSLVTDEYVKESDPEWLQHRREREELRAELERVNAEIEQFGNELRGQA